MSSVIASRSLFVYLVVIPSATYMSEAEQAKTRKGE